MVFFNAIIQTIDAFKTFTPAFIISSGTGNPINSTLFYTLYLYQEAFGFFRMGYASALAWMLLVVVAVFTGVSFLTRASGCIMTTEARPHRRHRGDAARAHAAAGASVDRGARPARRRLDRDALSAALDALGLVPRPRTKSSPPASLIPILGQPRRLYPRLARAAA